MTVDTVLALERTRTDEFGLALSGGGFRAVLFHVGALWRLAEFGVLSKIDRFSSVSGGSIVTGRLAQVWDEFAAGPTVDAYVELIANPLDHFCTKMVDAEAISLGAFSATRTAADVLERIYRENLFDKSLQDIPDRPVFVFNSTNMQSGRSFRFTKKYLADWRLGLLENPDLPVARAVAASSAFPPLLAPVVLKAIGKFTPVPGADLNGNPEYTDRQVLADGGVYDNLGLETVWQRCATLLVSDAGAPFSVGAHPGSDWIRQPMRALDIATDQSRSLRKRHLIDDYKANALKGTYWGIDTAIADYDFAEAMPAPPSIVEPLASIRTRLDPFSDEERGHLVNWGYALADAAVRKYAAHLVSSSAPKPSWPKPAFALG